jgi:ketosteroid isomerase-like protein
MLLGLGACLLLTAACAPAPTGEPESAVGKVEDPSAMVSIREQYEAAENAGDAAAVAALWASDGILLPPNAAAVEGSGAIQARYEAQFKEAKIEASIDGDETVISGNWGFERGTYSIKQTMADGKVVEDKGKYIVLMTRQPDGGVKVSRLIFNSDLPVTAAAAAATGQ